MLKKPDQKRTPLEVNVGEGDLDPSEVRRIRERLLVNGSEFDQVDLKIRRIWLIGTVCGLFFVAWIDGRFGVVAPNAVPVETGPPAAQLAEDGSQVSDENDGEILTAEGE